MESKRLHEHLSLYNTLVIFAAAMPHLFLPDHETFKQTIETYI